MRIACCPIRRCSLTVGDPSEEEVEPSVIDLLRTPIEPMPITPRYLPRDPQRLEAAQRLALCSYLILFFHELAHVELAHLDFLRAELGVTEHREIMALPASAAEASMLRALEWDADNSSLASSLQIWRTMYKNFNYTCLDPLGPATSWFLAAQLLFWVMDFMQLPVAREPMATHLSPMARRVNAELISRHVRSGAASPDEGNGTSLIPWIIRNDFPSAHVAAVREGRDVPEQTVQELVEAREGYRAILPDLERVQADRARRRGPRL